MKKKFKIKKLKRHSYLCNWHFNFNFIYIAILKIKKKKKKGCYYGIPRDGHRRRCVGLHCFKAQQMLTVRLISLPSQSVNLTTFFLLIYFPSHLIYPSTDTCPLPSSHSDKVPLACVVFLSL